MSTSVFREVFGMCVFVLAITAMVIGVSCKPAEPAQPKFVTLEQDDARNQQKLSIDEYALINKVHYNDHGDWNIFYGFSDNNRCDGQFTDTHLSQLKDKILESFEVWLEPLKDRAGIIDKSNINLELRSTIPTDKSRLSCTATTEIKTIDPQDSDLSIVFYCESCKSVASFAYIKRSNPEIHIFRDKRKVEPHQWATGLHEYYESTAILHEMGHIFGLGDTYVDSRDSRKDPCTHHRLNVSTGGISSTIGAQPISVMNKDWYFVEASDGTLKLSLDDRAAIRWLYSRRFEGSSTSACDCPYDYVYEVESGGCRPKYPLIFEVKQGILSKDMFSHFSDEDVNQKDELGNTALHYAAANKKHRPLLYDELLEFLSSNNHKDTITNPNKLVFTAQDIYDSEDSAKLLYSNDGLETAKDKHQQEIAETCKWMEFMLAVRDHNKNSEMEELLDVVDINKQDYYGYTALHYAAGSLNVAMTRVLLAHNSIDIYVSTHAGYTPFGLLMLDGSDDELKKCAEGSGLDYLTNQYDPNNLYDSIRSDRRMPEICPTILDRNSLPYYASKELEGVWSGVRGVPPTIIEEKKYERWCDVVMLFLQKK